MVHKIKASLVLNYKTTLAGLLMILMAGIGLYKDPNLITKPEFGALIAAATGLLAASDSKSKT